MTLAVAVWRRGSKLLLGRRRETGLFGGLWELPTGEIESESAATSPLAALQRAVGAEIQIVEPIGTVRRVLTHRNLRLDLYRVKGRASPKTTPAYKELRWVPPKEAAGLGMSAAMEHALRLASPTSVRTSA
jgi:adenine-specific DNA glycosylase